MLQKDYPRLTKPITLSHTITYGRISYICTFHDRGSRMVTDIKPREEKEKKNVIFNNINVWYTYYADEFSIKIVFKHKNILKTMFCAKDLR